MSVLDDSAIRRLILEAWHDSQPGTDAAHEEGGFVLRNEDGSMTIEHWPRGAKNQIVVPPHPAGKRGDSVVVATFHTHPNTGPNYQQEPSLTDIRAVRDDENLSHAEYEGEYVIAAKLVYRILKDGRVEEVGETEALLAIH